MIKEHGRHLRRDDEAERKLTMGGLACNWRPRTRDLFRDIDILMRDTGMRNERELFRMRIENLDWQNRVIFVPDSKTAEGRRLVPMSGRVFEMLRARWDARQEGWVFPSKRSASEHLRSICNLFRKARNKAALPKELVLYCARHDYGTRVLMRTGNLAAVMKTMGHRDVKTAMHYQHPELEVVRAALDYDGGAAADRRMGLFFSLVGSGLASLLSLAMGIGASKSPGPFCRSGSDLPCSLFRQLVTSPRMPFASS